VITNLVPSNFEESYANNIVIPHTIFSADKAIC